MFREVNSLGISVSGSSENLVPVEMPGGESILVEQSDIKMVLGKRLLSNNGKLYAVSLRENSGDFYATEQT